MNELDRLLAIAEIREAKARYCRLLDTRAWVAWGELFTDDAVLDVSDDVKPGMGDPEIVGREHIVAQTRALVGTAICTHLVHEPEIAFIEEDQADVIWGMQDKVTWEEGVSSPISARCVRGFGWYHERYVRSSSEWKIARLKLVRQQVEFS